MIFVPGRAIIKVSGLNLKDFFQPILTCDLKKLSPENALYGMLLTPQGKFLYDMFLYEIEGDIWLDVFKETSNELLTKLKIYCLRQKIQFQEKPNFTIAYDADSAFACFNDPRVNHLPKRCLVNDAPEDFSKNSYEKMRIENCLPEGGSDLTQNKSFPLEFGLDKLSAISFEKGCYVGQEVVARTKYRGVIRKKPYHFTLKTEAKCLKNSEIILNGKKIGYVTSFFENSGIALIRDADLPEDFLEQKILINGFEANLTLPKWY